MVWLAGNTSLSPTEQVGWLNTSYVDIELRVLCPICWSFRMEWLYRMLCHPSSKDVLSAEQRVEENVFHLFCPNHRDATSICGEAAASWSSHWCSVSYTLKCYWGLATRRYEKDFCSLYLTFSVLLLFHAIPKRFMKEPSFHVSLFMRVMLEG